MKTFALYILAILMAAGCGWLQISLHDLLLTALAVLASTMFLGALHPNRPWMWAVIFVAIVLTAHLLTSRTNRTEVLASCLVIVPAIVGAYGGSLMRHAVRALWRAQ
jgi:hypothetical protein